MRRSSEWGIALRCALNRLPSVSGRLPDEGLLKVITRAQRVITTNGPGSLGELRKLSVVDLSADQAQPGVDGQPDEAAEVAVKSKIDSDHTRRGEDGKRIGQAKHQHDHDGSHVHCPVVLSVRMQQRTCGSFRSIPSSAALAGHDTQKVMNGIRPHL